MALNDKNKLLALLSVTDMEYEEAVLLANYLIESGVTFKNTRDRWIPVTERLPDVDGRYLVFYGGDYPFVSTIRFGWKSKRGVPKGWYRFDHEDGNISQNKYITHWKPLPAPPMEEDEK